jgi:hypothetical protein
MPYSCRNDHHVARPNFDCLPFGTAEGDARPAADHAKDLVGGAVVVVVWEDAVYPGAAPAVPGE